MDATANIWNHRSPRIPSWDKFAFKASKPQTTNLSIQTFSTLNDRNPSKPFAIYLMLYIYDIFMLNRYSTCRLLNATYRTTYNDNVPDTLTNKWLTYRLPNQRLREVLTMALYDLYWLWPKCWLTLAITFSAHFTKHLDLWHGGHCGVLGALIPS